MEELPAAAMERKSRPRKLDLNAPFLSTRRPTGITTIELPHPNSRHPSWDTSNRVPFSWEQSPGKPKGGLKTYVTRDMDVPPPKLPPGRWHPPTELANNNRNDHDKVDDGCDGDVDDDCDKFNEGNFSDAIDIFSLSESIDIFETVGMNIRDSNAIQSPSFIIQRYLSDAKALAAASAPQLAVDTSNNYHVSRSVRQSYSSPKSCGLDIFFPWRMKHKLCGVKSPVKPTRRKPSCSLAASGFDSCH